ncbi:uncharacterized protein LOC129594603 [Paramacrobiotus metropolitanus]|uniref:uncharacterized protein LOC129594603 n=1 Tax=Paramacrobiotus metropolitanus TaxID=2943436 RepID=UPI002445A2C2|nr:uncharacterized protein LOC129594603 [Paramacrobiotus metropolitanus]
MRVLFGLSFLVLNFIHRTVLAQGADGLPISIPDLTGGSRSVGMQSQSVREPDVPADLGQPGNDAIIQTNQAQLYGSRPEILTYSGASGRRVCSPGRCWFV